MFSMQMNMMKNMSSATNGMFSGANIPGFGFATGNGATNGSTNGSAENPMNQMLGLYENWRDMYNSWASAMGKVAAPAQSMFGSFGNPTADNAFQNLSNMATSYFKLFEFWAPMMKTMQNGWNEETFRSMFNPQEYNRILNSAFNFVSPESLQAFTDQVSKLMSSYGDFSGNNNAAMSDMMQHSMKAMSQFASGNIDEAVKIYIDMMNQAQKPFEPVAKMLFIGKDRVAMDLVQELLRSYMLFVAQYAKVQQTVSTAGQKALQECMTLVADMTKEGNAPKSYDEFFKIWLKTNETAFDAIFKTDEYGRLQGDLNTSSAKIREYADKLMELSMSDIPVALRSELDEAYKSIHDLKRQVRALDRKVEEQHEMIEALNGGEAKTAGAANAAPKKAVAKK